MNHRDSGLTPKTPEERDINISIVLLLFWKEGFSKLRFTDYCPTVQAELGHCVYGEQPS